VFEAFSGNFFNFFLHEAIFRKTPQMPQHLSNCGERVAAFAVEIYND